MIVYLHLFSEKRKNFEVSMIKNCKKSEKICYYAKMVVMMNLPQSFGSQGSKASQEHIV